MHHARAPLRQILWVCALVCAAVFGVTRLEPVPGLGRYVHLVVAAIFLLTAIRLTRGDPQHYGLSLGGLLDPSDDDRSPGPLGLLDLAKGLERELGRVAGPRFGPRSVDCDLLLWEGGEVRDPRLRVPHPRLAGRRFALVPLLDLDPALALPDGRSIAALAAALDPADQPVEPAALELAVPEL